MQKPSVSHTENYQAGMESKHGDVLCGLREVYVSRMTSSCVLISKLLLGYRVRGRLNKTWRNEQSICHIYWYLVIFYFIYMFCFHIMPFVFFLYIKLFVFPILIGKISTTKK